MSPDHTDFMLATMMRVDPERIAAVRRAMSGVTRCPRCEETNRADQRHCSKCGAALYPELEVKEAERKEREERKRRRK